MPRLPSQLAACCLPRNPDVTLVCSCPVREWEGFKPGVKKCLVENGLKKKKSELAG